VSEPFKVRYFEDLQSLRASFESDPEFGHNILFQEFVPGEGVGVEVLMHDGVAVCAFQHRRLRELPWAGGVSVVAESEMVDPTLLGQATRLLRALGAEGMCMVEYRRDPDTGRTVFMEINARAIGSMSLSERCGVEFPWYHWQLLHDQRPDTPTTYPVGLRWRWTAGVLLRLDSLDQPGPPWEPHPSRIAEWLGSLGDLLPPTRDALWSWTDPLPAIAETAGITADIAKRQVKRLVRWFLPECLFRRLQEHRYQSPVARSWRRRRRIARVFGGLRARSRIAPERITRILVVCHGNIFRSPMFEHLLRRELARAGDTERYVMSGGLHAHDGGNAHPNAIKIATEFGIDLAAQRARAITPALIDASDLVIAMDFVNEAELLACHPTAKGKILVIGDLVGGDGGVPVADPYGRELDVVRRRYVDLANRATALGDWLAHRPAASGDSTNPDPV
jgi:protein-tyrosine-phosphatase